MTEWIDSVLLHTAGIVCTAALAASALRIVLHPHHLQRVFFGSSNMQFVDLVICHAFFFFLISGPLVASFQPASMFLSAT